MLKIWNCEGLTMMQYQLFRFGVSAEKHRQSRRILFLF